MKIKEAKNNNHNNKIEIEVNMNKKGVTLIALAITLLVMIVLTSTSIYFGFRAVHKTSNFKTYSNLSLLYAKVEEISEKYHFNPLETDLPGFELTAEMRSALAGLGIATTSPLWRFLTEENLEEMNLPKKIKEVGTNIFVDYETIEIVYTKGYRKAEDTFVYKYSEMQELERMSENE